MKKINVTQKDLPIQLMLFISEMMLISTDAEMKSRSLKFSDRSKGGTTKFDELIEAIQPIQKELNSLTNFMNYCFNTSSSVKENELIHDKNIAISLLQILLAIDNKEIEKAVLELGRKAEIKNKERKRI